MATREYSPTFHDSESSGVELGPKIRAIHELTTQEPGQGPVREVRGKWREYSLLCAAMCDDDGEMLIVRKDPNAHSIDPTDWLVSRVIPADEPHEYPLVIEERVLSSDTYRMRGKAGDTIELTIGQHERSDRGSFIVSLTVDDLYGPIDEQPVTVLYPDRYGERNRPEGMMVKELRAYHHRVPGVEYAGDTAFELHGELGTSVTNELGYTALQAAA